MPIQKLYRVQCSDAGCGMFLPRLWARMASAVTVDPSAALLFTSYEDAQQEAAASGWSLYPLLCPYSQDKLKQEIEERQGS